MIEYCMIVAASENNVIANEDGIPWDIEEDFEHYKRTVSGSPIVSGRRTFEAMGKWVPGDFAVVLSRQESYMDHKNNVRHAQTFNEATKIAEEEADENETVFVVGGESVYKHFLPKASRMIVSRVHEVYDGTVFFPDFDKDRWQLKDESSHDRFTIREYISNN